MLVPITDIEGTSWDNVALMEYRSFEDFRTVLESGVYKAIAEEHRFAALGGN